MATCESRWESLPGATRQLTYRCVLPAGHGGLHRAPSGNYQLDDSGHRVSSGEVDWSDRDSGTIQCGDRQ